MSADRPVRDTAQRAAAYVSLWGQSLWRGLKQRGERAWNARRSFGSATDLRGLLMESRGYLAAIAGVAAVSLLIALIESQVRIRNISLLYLLVVLWLAAVYGRIPAIIASVLAFLAYDFLFISPVHTFTVSDPAEWLSLGALLATSLVLGQLTAAVQARAREALESRKRIATLYSLAQLIVTTTEQDRLYAALVERVVQVFAPQGVRACSLVLRGEPIRPQTQAIAPADSPYASVLSLELRENAASALWALEHDATVGGSHGGDAGARDALAFFVPLKSGRSVVGVLGIAGTEEIRRLTESAPRLDRLDRLGGPTSSGAEHEQQLTLFAAFCDQIALALDRVALEQQAIHAEALRESDRLKDVLLGSVTHELRTPIASIKAAASSLLQPDMTWSDDDRREFLESIDVSAERLNRLVGNLLDLSRLEAGSAQPEKDLYPIGDVIATVLDRLDLTGQMREHRVTVDVPDETPLVPMDYAQIEQVLTNLIENAFKYSPAESEVRIAARALPSSELEVRVRDQGVGIPSNELEAIFDKFYRVQHVRLPWATARPPMGTGLGLAVCAAIIRSHGGRIWAESAPGSGSTFIFTLPMAQDQPQGVLPEVEAPVRETKPATESREVGV
jgi:two-component system sensor histidine kinase KdpD